MHLQRFMHRRRKDADLAEEMSAHLAFEEDANTARGLQPKEAHRQARLRFGNPQTTREQVWRYRSIPWLDDIARDLRFVIRSLAKTPGFSIIAILVIAVGIGVNTAVFSVINTVLLKPLSYPDPQALVQLMNSGPRGSFPGANVPKYNIWRKQTSVFQQVAGYDFGGAGLNLTGGDHPQQVQGIHVTSDYFAMFGAPLIIGRSFTAAEDSPNGGRNVVLSYSLWKSRFGGNPNIVGTPIQIDNQPYLVVGVVGRSFVTDPVGDLWLPFQFDPNSHDMAHYFTVAARLKSGITIQQANAQLKLTAEQYQREYGGAPASQEGFSVISLQESIIGDTRYSLFILFGAVIFVLLIACANVANLLLARASVRKREFATRAALGAGRAQIIRQLLTESLALSLTGGLLGLIVGFVGLRLLLNVSPGGIPRLGEDGSAVTLDAHILIFTLGISVLTGILFGLVPAISASRTNLAATLNESSSRSGLGLRSGKIRSGLVVTEMALALILVIGAGLLIRTYLKLQAVDPGFETHNVLTMAMSISGDRFQKSANVDQIIRDGTDRLKALPGVANAAAGCCLPLVGGFGVPFDIVGRPKGANRSTGGAGYYSVSGNYFDVFRIPVLRGRVFTDRDNAASPNVVMINETMAKQYWPNGDPLKDRLLTGVGMGPIFAEPARQIIGIVGDTHDGALNETPRPTMYFPVAQMPDAETALNSRVAPLWWAIRTKGDPHDVVASITAALRDATGGLPVAHVLTMDEIVLHTTARQRFNMLLLIIFGASGLLMAAIGVYGLMAYSVQQRTQEIGIRMALGAQASSLRNMVIRQGMTLALLGVAVGIAGAFWLTRLLASLLFGVTAWDPAAFLATPFLLTAVALLAIWIPARLATDIDPMTALRSE
ncbi:ABC transporter permease [Granulicella arctica]|uniref:ABC transporter permease n=1 Tax=Granulicella arctica TaxID=940613 RepID=UPI0021E051CB|nr:ABC transporter permease [Granulicella arctica]